MGLNRELISQVVDRKSSLNGIGDTMTVLMCDSLLKVPFLKKKKRNNNNICNNTVCYQAFAAKKTGPYRTNEISRQVKGDSSPT